MIKNLFTALTTSNGNKRLIAIIMMGLGIVATITGVSLPGNSEEVVTKILEVVGLAIGTWGAVHAQLAKKSEERKTENVQKAIGNSPVVQAANEALK